MEYQHKTYFLVWLVTRVDKNSLFIRWSRQIKYDKENVTSLLKGLQKIEDMPFSTIEVEESSKYSYFCYRCANLDEFKKNLNGMTINLRTECNNKEDSTHSINRIFCFPKGVCPIAKMTIKLQNHSVSCVVDNRPVKLEIKEVFR